jgi:quercetin dioxygenase-like cupin family protein
MPPFPPVVARAANRIAAHSQYIPAIEGYVYDGADGSQVAFWSCERDRVSEEHSHDFDEYVLVVEGEVTALLPDRSVVLRAGQELVIPKGMRQRMAVRAGTRTIHVFGGRRAERQPMQRES